MTDRSQHDATDAIPQPIPQRSAVGNPVEVHESALHEARTRLLAPMPSIPQVDPDERTPCADSIDNARVGTCTPQYRAMLDLARQLERERAALTRCLSETIEARDRALKRVREFEEALPYTFALESALRSLYECAEAAHWPTKAEHMLPMNQARAALKKSEAA